MHWAKRLSLAACAVGLSLSGNVIAAGTSQSEPSTTAAAPASQSGLSPSEQALLDRAPLLQLGPGDQVKMEVFGRPEMDTTTYISDDGSVSVPLAGAVKVGGSSPAEAARRVEAALKNGQFLVDPHVTFTVLQTRSQRVSVLGEVRVPGRYPVESNTTVLDVIAQAGGATDKGADVIFILRPDGAGGLRRLPVNLRGAVDAKDAAPAVMQTLQGGDSVLVPPADKFYIAGEVHMPAEYRLDSGMTLLQAIARAGGVTDRGSTSRVQIKRKGPKGNYIVISGKAGDKIQPDDVITVKERIF